MTPICCGESLYLRHGFTKALEKRAADVMMPNLKKCGVLLEVRRIADLAHAYYAPFPPYCVVPQIDMMGSAHTVAAVPNVLALERQWVRDLGIW